MNSNPEQPANHDEARRSFLKQSSLLTAMVLVPGPVAQAASAKLDEALATAVEQEPLKLEINGKKYKLTEMQGYLQKKSPVLMKGWQKRYFKILNTGEMVYYKTVREITLHSAIICAL